jgi:hypothetical protein
MVLDQRNAGASVTPTASTYTLDRWFAQLSAASKYSVQQNAGSVTPPAGFTNYLGVTSTSAYAITSSDQFNINQRIEGFNIADLGWGTANAKTVTLSFWVRSSLTGTFGGAITNSGVDRSYPFTFTISAANTWEQKSVTVAGDTTGTWVTNNGIGIRLYINLGAGSTFSSSTTNAWQAGSFFSATSSTSVIALSQQFNSSISYQPLPHPPHPLFASISNTIPLSSSNVFSLTFSTFLPNWSSGKSFCGLKTSVASKS